MYFYKTYRGKPCVPGDLKITKKEFSDKKLRPSTIGSRDDDK
jgi:hypothetical protein